MKCLHCQNDVAATATVCPHCGAQPPHGGATAHAALVKILGSIVAIFVLGKFFGLF